MAHAPPALHTRHHFLPRVAALVRGNGALQPRLCRQHAAVQLCAKARDAVFNAQTFQRRRRYFHNARRRAELCAHGIGGPRRRKDLPGRLAREAIARQPHLRARQFAVCNAAGGGRRSAALQKRRLCARPFQSEALPCIRARAFQSHIVRHNEALQMLQGFRLCRRRQVQPKVLLKSQREQIADNAALPGKRQRIDRLARRQVCNVAGEHSVEPVAAVAAAHCNQCAAGRFAQRRPRARAPHLRRHRLCAGRGAHNCDSLKPAPSAPGAGGSTTGAKGSAGRATGGSSP